MYCMSMQYARRREVTAIAIAVAILSITFANLPSSLHASSNAISTGPACTGRRIGTEHRTDQSCHLHKDKPKRLQNPAQAPSIPSNRSHHFHCSNASTHLQPTIQNIHDIMPCPRAPIAARLLHDVRQLDLVGDAAFDEVENHAFAGVPGDVAVELWGCVSE